MTIAIPGYGATAYLDNAGGTPTLVGEVVSFTPFAMSVGTADATHLSSTSGHREFISTLTDGGEASVTINFLPGDATDILVRTAMTDRLVRTLKFTFPNTKYVQSEVFVTGYEPADTTADGKMEMSFNVKATGVPTYG